MHLFSAPKFIFMNHFTCWNISKSTVKYRIPRWFIFFIV
ncbi:hypothetical protein [Plasmodium yoelii yoelii]|uniref:Uncharacterized protein n=1 Tax=Plasmodium yoelii yoelii TaxID=73239 RepID=Q7RPN4_PLAYO|nr:hypothetical protein [Plasmodium yoelii yoelii]